MSDSLTIIDNKLRLFAKEIGAVISKDETKGMWASKGFEERSLYWDKNGLSYSIRIIPITENDKIKKWLCVADCYSDRNKKRYSKSKALLETRNKDKIIANLSNLLLEANSFLQQLTFEDLEFDIDLSH